MSKKKKQAKNRKKRGFVPLGNEGPPPIDLRIMEHVMRDLVFGAEDSDEPVDKAQEIIYEAWEAESPEEQKALALEAIEMSPDCADAYVLLAENASSLQEAIEYYRQGVAAGERALGEDGFVEFEGHFWGALETRPYMRAARGLAECLWLAGRRDEAVERYRALLELNPNDNQGIRYPLVSALLELKRHDEVESLLKQYDDDASADWAYSRALLAFQQQGDTEHSRNLLVGAHEQNQHVAAYLTGAKPMPMELPHLITVGGEQEAVGYVASALAAWKKTPEATAWIRKTLKVSRSATRQARSPSWAQMKKVLGELPQTADEIWEVELLSLASPGSGTEKLWALLVVDADTGQPVIFDFLDERPKDREVWQAILQAMRQPDEGDPHRPAEVCVARKTFFKTWQSKLKQVGIECRLCERLEAVDRAIEESMPPAEMLERIGNLGSSGDSENWPDIAELPEQVGEIWQADIRPVSTWIEVDGQMQRPSMLLVADATNGLIMATEIIESEPAADWLWQGVHAALCRPAVGEPHRPSVIQVASETQRLALAPHLDPAGIRCFISGELDFVETLVGELSEKLGGSEGPKPLVSSPGVSFEQLGEFYCAAAAFYQQQPWLRIPGDTVVEIRCSAFQSGPWYGVVMGQSGMTFGVALYEDSELLRDLLSGGLTDEERSRRTSALSMTFGEEFEIALQDLDAIEQHGWPIAAPEAYPSVMRINPGFAMRVPLSWELEFLEACLRTLPEFLTAGAQEQTLQATVNHRELSLVVSRRDDFLSGGDAF